MRTNRARTSPRRINGAKLHLHRVWLHGVPGSIDVWASSPTRAHSAALVVLHRTLVAAGLGTEAAKTRNPLMERCEIVRPEVNF